MTADIIAAFGQFGLPGLVIAFLGWERWAVRKDDRATVKERSESDKALASALTALTVTIQHLEDRVR